jgi:hypothetical protein
VSLPIQKIIQLATGSKSAKQHANGLLKSHQRKTSANNLFPKFEKVNHPNYNPFYPLFEEELKGKPRAATMSDEIDRQRFLKAMNGDFDDDDDPSTLPLNNNTLTNQEHSTSPITTTDTTIRDTNQAEPAIADSTSGNKNNNDNAYFLAQELATHAPKNLTWVYDYKQRGHENLEGNPDNNFALVVRIGQKKNEKLKFHDGRILTAILRSFQQVSPYIKIVPINKKRSGISDIKSPDQIQYNEAFYSHYIEDRSCLPIIIISVVSIFQQRNLSSGSRKI